MTSDEKQSRLVGFEVKPQLCFNKTMLLGGKACTHTLTNCLCAEKLVIVVPTRQRSLLTLKTFACTTHYDLTPVACDDITQKVDIWVLNQFLSAITFFSWAQHNNHNLGQRLSGNENVKL